jgi:RHS repeat-associated protein
LRIWRDANGGGDRSELTSALLYTNSYGYALDPIGNRIVSSLNGSETAYTANALNQYTAVSNPANPVIPANVSPLYDADGHQKSAKLKAKPQGDRDFEATYMCGARSGTPRHSGNCYTTSLGPLALAWDAENRLTSVSTLQPSTINSSLLTILNSYDYRHRRVRKTTPAAEHRNIYDNWNLIQETVAHTNGAISTHHNYWGLDLSGTLQGAGGVGGLLAVKINGQLFFPFYDSNGNVTEYIDASGTVRAHYEYNPYGETTVQSGDMADVFCFRFSTKYHDPETGFYYYGYRFYHPALDCFINRDPIGEDGGLNLYGFADNDPVGSIDVLGWNPITIKELPVIYTDYPLPDFSGDTLDSGRVTWSPNPPGHRSLCKCTAKDTYKLDLTIEVTITTKIPGPKAKHLKTGKPRTADGIKNSESHEALHRKMAGDLFRGVEASYSPLMSKTWTTWFDCDKEVGPIRKQNEERINIALRMEEKHAGQHWMDWFDKHGKESKW